MNLPLCSAMNCRCKTKAQPVASSGARQHRKQQAKASLSDFVNGFRRLGLTQGTLSIKGTSSTSPASRCWWGPADTSCRTGRWQGHPSHQDPISSASCASRDIMDITRQSKSEDIMALSLCRWAFDPSSATRNGLLVHSGEDPLKYVPLCQDDRRSFSIGRT